MQRNIKFECDIETDKLELTKDVFNFKKENWEHHEIEYGWVHSQEPPKYLNKYTLKFKVEYNMSQCDLLESVNSMGIEQYKKHIENIVERGLLNEFSLKNYKVRNLKITDYGV